MPVTGERIHPATKHLRAAAAYLTTARARANAAMRRRFTGGAPWRRARPAHFLEGQGISFIVGCAPMIDLRRVEALPGDVLRLHFSNGETRLFSLAQYRAEFPLARLTPAQFSLATLRDGAVCWPGDPRHGDSDIAPELLHELSSPA